MGNSWSHVKPIIAVYRETAVSICDWWADIQGKTICLSRMLGDIFSVKFAKCKPSRVNQFLYHLYREEVAVDRHRTKAEIHDIGMAVSDMVENIVGTAFSKDPVLQIPKKSLTKHIVGVGSYFEKTKIKDADEFDFTFVLPYFNEDNVRVVKEVLYSPIHRCRHGVEKDPFAYVELEYVGLNTDLLTEKNLLTNIRARRYLVACRLFTIAKDMVDECLSNRTNILPIFRETGTLSCQGNKSSLNGPAMMLNFKWYQHSGHGDLNIRVDLVPAVKARLPSRMFDYITAPHVMKREISDVRSCLFIPKNKPHVSVDFFISFCQIETRLIQVLKTERPQWFFCFCVLKFIFWQDSQTQLTYNHMFSSYILKNLLLQEALICNEKYITLVECLMKMLFRLQRYTDTSIKGSGTHIEIRTAWFLDSSITCRSLKDQYDRKELEIVQKCLEDVVNVLIDIDRCDLYEYTYHKSEFLNVVETLNTSLSALNMRRKSVYSQTG